MYPTAIWQQHNQPMTGSEVSYKASNGYVRYFILYCTCRGFTVPFVGLVFFAFFVRDTDLEQKGQHLGQKGHKGKYCGQAWDKNDKIIFGAQICRYLTLNQNLMFENQLKQAKLQKGNDEVIISQITTSTRFKQSFE